VKSLEVRNSQDRSTRISLLCDRTMGSIDVIDAQPEPGCIADSSRLPAPNEKAAHGHFDVGNNITRPGFSLKMSFRCDKAQMHVIAE
jgi:hypothetical protein